MTLPPITSPVRPRLTTLVTVGVSATVLLTVLCLLILVDHFALAYARAEAEQRLQQLSWQMRDALNNVVRKATGDVQLLAELEDVRAARTPADVRQVLENLQKTFPDYAWIGLANPDGTVYAATQGLLENVNVGERDWFKGGQDKIYAGDFHPATLLGNKLPASADPWRFVDAAGPVRDAQGNYRGVLCVHMSWGWARRLVQNILAPADRQYSADIFVVRGDGTIMLGPRGMEEQKLAADSLKLAQSGASGALSETWPDGKRYLTGYARSGNPEDASTLTWSILVRQPEELALSGVRSLEHQILALGAVLGLVLAAGAAVVARRFTAPLNLLSGIIERRLAATSGGPALPLVPQLDAYHEVQVLSRALAEMLRDEQRHLDNLRSLNEKLETTVAERTREIARKALLLERALAQEQSTQQLLQERAAELRAILDNAHDAFIALDPGGVVRDWNLQAERLLGWKRAEVIGQPLAAMMLPPLLRRAYERDMRQLAETQGGAVAAAAAAALSRRVELTLYNRDGRELPVEASLAYVPGSGGHLFIAFLHDISQRKALFASMEAMALRDTLTGLPNRRALMQALAEALRRADRSRQCCAVFFLDLDRFKQVNDRYGHEEGDELLRQFAARVRDAVRQTDTVGRLAGDEFIVILEMLQNDAAAQEAADKLQPVLARPFVLKTATVQLSASIGIAIHHPDDPQDIESLLSRADRAMYRHKQQGLQQRARR
ncbi:diguanylate cyclase domain-containing protein [Duganella callida]|uniref:Diguanylate cyclase n=1 Tax=Duganella callida TaxID=2561932 RepID=A0A4Y9SBS9_9BURK|nr:diguanylate cyclase [Duganella callida]TFW17735.1 diguanylate cyclase [Duganella callida]